MTKEEFETEIIVGALAGSFILRMGDTAYFYGEMIPNVTFAVASAWLSSHPGYQLPTLHMLDVMDTNGLLVDCDFLWMHNAFVGYKSVVTHKWLQSDLYARHCDDKKFDMLTVRAISMNS